MDKEKVKELIDQWLKDNLIVNAKSDPYNVISEIYDIGEAQDYMCSGEYDDESIQQEITDYLNLNGYDDNDLMVEISNYKYLVLFDYFEFTLSIFYNID